MQNCVRLSAYKAVKETRMSVRTAVRELKHARLCHLSAFKTVPEYQHINKFVSKYQHIKVCHVGILHSCWSLTLSTSSRNKAPLAPQLH